MSLEFRVIEIERRSPFRIAAMDHAVMEACKEGRSPPTLIYHNWEKSVSLAKGQAMSDLNLEECERQGFKVVRLPTGGKAVIHFPDTEFSYTLCVPNTGINPREAYKKYCERIGNALRSLGVSSVSVDNNDIFVGEKKIGGNAQWVSGGWTLQHGLLLYEQPDAQTMLSLMHLSLYHFSAEEELKALVTGFHVFSHASQQQLRDVLTAHLLGGYKWKRGTLTEEEEAQAGDMERQYRNPHDPKATQTRGLCWLPAPIYRREEMELEEATR